MKLKIAFCLLASCMALGAAEEKTSKIFQAAPGGSLVVDVDFGSIEISTNPVASQINVEVWRKAERRNKEDEEQFLRENPVVFSYDNNTLTIRSRTAQPRRWFSGRGIRNQAKYNIRVPAAFNVDIDTSGGGISVSDLTGGVTADTSGGGLRFTRLHGAINADTSGGGIHVTDCEGAIEVDTSGGGIDVSGGGGSLRGDTSGGDVTVKLFDGPASVNTSGGGIEIHKVNGKIDASTSGGSVRAALLAPIPGAVRLSTSGGSVTLAVPAGAAFDLDAETSGGNVSSHLPVTVQGKIEHGKLKGVVNNGGPVVILRSSGGDIQIRELHP